MSQSGGILSALSCFSALEFHMNVPSFILKFLIRPFLSMKLPMPAYLFFLAEPVEYKSDRFRNSLRESD